MESIFSQAILADLPSFHLVVGDLANLCTGLEWLLGHNELKAAMFTSYRAAKCRLDKSEDSPITGFDDSPLERLRAITLHHHVETVSLGIPNNEWLLLLRARSFSVLAVATRIREDLEIKVSFRAGLVRQLAELVAETVEPSEALREIQKGEFLEDTDSELAGQFILKVLESRHAELRADSKDENRMFRLAEQSLDLIYRIQLNPKFKILYISPIIETWMGCTRDELYQDARTAFRHIHPEDGKILQRMMVEENASQGVTQVRFIPAEGEAYWIEHRWFVDRSTDRSVIVLDGVGRDITRQKRQEEAIGRALQLAEENARSKSLFLANMSHEIRTPLNAIIGQVELLKDTVLNCDQKEMLESVHSAGQILLSHLTDVLDFSRLDAQRVKLQPESFSLVGALSEALSLVKESAREKGLLLEHSFHPDTPAQVIGDKAKLVQIVVNLLSNAVKFTDSGTISLKLESFPEHSRVKTVIEVSDTGIGFPAEQFGELILPFSQADPSTTRKQEGAGLGLAIVNRLVELMGGQLEARSEIGQGSTLSIQMEFEVEPGTPGWDGSLATTLYTTPVEEVSFPNDLNILVVEDNDVNRKVLQRQLSKLKLTNLDFALNGEEALNIFRPEYHDIVLMDIQMPVLDGVQALQALRDRYSDLQTPVVAVTAHALPGDRENYLEAGFQAYLSKPVNLAELRKVLTQTLTQDQSS